MYIYIFISLSLSLSLSLFLFFASIYHCFSLPPLMLHVTVSSFLRSLIPLPSVITRIIGAELTLVVPSYLSDVSRGKNTLNAR